MVFSTGARPAVERRDEREEVGGPAAPIAGAPQLPQANAMFEAIDADSDGVITQRNPEVEDPSQDELYPVGVACMILKLFKLPDGNQSIIVHGLARIRLKQLAQNDPFSVGEIEVNGVGYYFSHLSALAAGVFAHGGIEEMQALLEKHKDDPLLPPKYQDGGFAAHPWYTMAREDTGEAAIAYLQEHPEKTELAGAFLSGIEDADRMDCVLHPPRGIAIKTRPRPKSITVSPTRHGRASV